MIDLIYQQLPNYFAESLSKVRRFHDPSSCSPLSRTSSHDSLDSLNISDNTNDFGKVTNTVKAIEQVGAFKGQAKTFQLPSLITPVSLFGKRIR
jgi:lysophospholipase